MTNTFTSFTITSLCEISFIAGTYRELTFDVYDATNNPVDISSGYTFKWVLSPYGSPNVTSLSKDGTYIATTDKNRFIVYLYSTDTVSLSGKYVQQPIIIIDDDHQFRMGQGYVIIVSTVTI